jgi:8-hydroxy-5-deazaflavin:NADPH oxidoreductase
VKAFNTTFALTLIAGEVAGQQLDVLITGDEAAKQKVSQPASDGDLRPIDVGPLGRAQQLEQLGFLHISLQQPLGLGFGSTVKLVTPFPPTPAANRHEGRSAWRSASPPCSISTGH